ncbi:hypothetical protein FN846DRAFT_908656 [Sphaerosporella brunnea]|uniref:N-acetyltransferase domain-containing protein n=1 Tax=Sphaerosporella brunnea TaxID=1250544 RepID=A0A5J5ES14_9PEZI|nr:hypothetical protein FN846DRAFT_908656 [Sphaerosporella brunnea]
MSNVVAQVVLYANVDTFLSTVSAALHKRERSNNIPLGTLPRFLTDTPPARLLPRVKNEDEGFILLSTFDVRGEPCVFAIKTPAHPAVGIYAAIDPGQGLHKHCEALAHALLHRDKARVPLHFYGDERLVCGVAEAIAQRLGWPWVLQREHTYNAVTLTRKGLSAEIPRKMEDGHEVRRVTAAELEALGEKLLEMHQAMFKETWKVEAPMQAAKEIITACVKAGDAWVCFVDGQPASVALLTGETSGGKSISAVYTRPEYRKKGYAQALVDTLSKAVLEEQPEGYYLCLSCVPETSAGRIFAKTGFGSSQTYTMANVKLAKDLGLARLGLGIAITIAIYAWATYFV